MCDWSKSDRKNDAKKLASLLKNATHFCRRCGRSANEKSVLCKPKPLD